MSLIKRIKIKVITFGSKRLVKLSMLINHPWLTAWAFALGHKKLGDKGGYKILCIGRSIFVDDVKAMTVFSGRLSYIVIHKSYFSIVFEHFCDKTERSKLTSSNYYTEDYCTEAKSKYKEYLSRMVPILKKILGFDAILSGNINYIEQQELAQVCHEQKIPFCVLHKEAIVVEDTYRKFVNNYKTSRFVGDKLMFYNRQCLEGMLGINLQGLTRDKAVLTGIPRFDYYFLKKNNELQTKKQIVLFSFLPRYSFRFITQDEQRLKKIEEISYNFIKSFMDFALKHKEIKVIIKTKAADYYLQYPQKIFQENFRGKISNLEIVNFGDPSELIKSSIAVAGFNSTTLIEALICNKLIIAPDFSEVITDSPWDFFHRHESLVNYSRSLGDLEKYISRPEQYSNYQAEVKNDFLEEFISTTKGEASRKTETAIIRTIEDFKKN